MALIFYTALFLNICKTSLYKLYAPYFIVANHNSKFFHNKNMKSQKSIVKFVIWK